MKTPPKITHAVATAVLVGAPVLQRMLSFRFGGGLAAS